MKMSLHTLAVIFLFAMTASPMMFAFETPLQAIDSASKAIRAKNYSQAHKDLLEGFRLAVNPVERFLVLSRHGELYKMEKDFVNAEKMVMQIINDAKMPANLKCSAYLNLARYKEEQKKYEDTVEAYQNALALNKEGAVAQETLNKCGLVLIRLKDYPGAIECFNQVLTITVAGKDAKRSHVLRKNAHINHANAFVAMKQYDKAVSILEKAAALDEFKDKKDQQEFQKIVVRLYEAAIREKVRLKKMDEAEKLLAGLKKKDKSSRIMGMQVMILTGKAAIALRKRDNAGAEKFYKEAVAVKGAAVADTVNAYNEYINFLLRQKRFSDTEKVLNTLLTLPAKDAETKFRIASCRKQYLVTVKKYDEAITLMEETAKLKGLRPATKARCYAFIAQICLFDKKDAASAMKYIKKAEGVPGGRWKCPAYMKKHLEK